MGEGIKSTTAPGIFLIIGFMGRDVTPGGNLDLNNLFKKVY